MSLGAQGQRLDADADELGGIGRQRRAEVTQLVGKDTGREGRGGRGVGEDEVVVGGVGLGEGRELAWGLLPVELARIDDGTAQRGAVATDPLGQRLDDDSRGGGDRLCREPSSVSLELYASSYSNFSPLEVSFGS